MQTAQRHIDMDFVRTINTTSNAMPLTKIQAANMGATQHINHLPCRQNEQFA